MSKATSVQQAMQLGGYAGWDPGVAAADFSKTGGPDFPGSGSAQSLNSNSLPTSVDPQKAVTDALNQAKQVRQFNIDSAQPQINTLQQNKSNLDTKYSDLLASIKGDQGLAVNNATKATNATMAARGLSTQDPMAQTNLAGAQSAAAQPYSSLQAQTGISQAQDENSIAAQIAALQAGNPEGALSSTNGINGLAQQLAQLGLQQNQQQFQQQYIPIPGYGLYDTSTKSLLGGLSSTGLSPTGNQVVGTY